MTTVMLRVHWCPIFGASSVLELYNFMLSCPFLTLIIRVRISDGTVIRILWETVVCLLQPFSTAAKGRPKWDLAALAFYLRGACGTCSLWFRNRPRCWAALPGRREHCCQGQNGSCSSSAILLRNCKGHRRRRGRLLKQRGSCPRNVFKPMTLWR